MVYKVTDLLDEVHDLLLGGVAGDELVNVGHDVHADVACELIPGLREGGGAEDKEGETEESLEEWGVNSEQVNICVCFFSCLVFMSF